MDVIIVGAGVTGLRLAHRLGRAGKQVLVLEADGRVGGAIRSLRTAGLVIECGPQALRARPNTLQTIADLAIEDRILVGAPSVSQRFILWDGKLRPVPRALTDRNFFKKRELLRALAEPFVPRRTPPKPDESAFDFVERRFGRAVAERLLDPFVAGIYAGDPHRTELLAAFPDLARWESKGSVLAGMLASSRRWTPPSWAPKVGYTLKGGVQSLTDTLAGALAGDVVRTDTPVERIERHGSGFRVLAKGEAYEAARVIVTVPPSRAAAIVPALTTELAAMPSSYLASVHLAFKASEAKSPEGFGWLAPTSQRRDVLGVVWASSVFPSMYPGRTVVRVMIGGAREDVSRLDDDQLLLRARKVVAEVEQIRADPVFQHVHRAYLPQYEVGHTARVERLQSTGVEFVGWAYTGNGVEAALGAGSV